MVLKINPFSQSNPMTLRDAVTVAFIVAFCTWILTFLVDASWAVISADPEAFVFEAVKTYAIAWAGTFITLAGLEQYVKRKEE